MKSYFFTILLLICSSVFAEETFTISSQNAILKNYRPFSTPRTNGRPGEVYRIDQFGKKYIVEDITAIKEQTSDEGTLRGRMYFTSGEMLSFLNLEFINLEIIPAEVEIKDAVREFNEQVVVDRILYDNERIESICVDSESEYFIIRETILTKEVTFRFTEETIKAIIRGKENLNQVKVKKDEKVDFPFEIQKKFKEPKRIFYLNQKITLEPYD